MPVTPVQTPLAPLPPGFVQQVIRGLQGQAIRAASAVLDRLSVSGDIDCGNLTIRGRFRQGMLPHWTLARSASQTISNNALTAIVFDQVFNNTGGPNTYSTATGAVTLPWSGLYLFSCGIAWITFTANASQVVLSMMYNGAESRRVFGAPFLSTSANPTSAGAAAFSGAAGATVQAGVIQNSGVNQSTFAGSLTYDWMELTYLGIGSGI